MCFRNRVNVWPRLTGKYIGNICSHVPIIIVAAICVVPLGPMLPKWTPWGAWAPMSLWTFLICSLSPTPSRGSHGPMGPHGPIRPHGALCAHRAHGPMGPHEPIAPHGHIEHHGAIGPHGPTGPQLLIMAVLLMACLFEFSINETHEQVLYIIYIYIYMYIYMCVSRLFPFPNTLARKPWAHGALCAQRAPWAHGAPWAHATHDAHRAMGPWGHTGP